MIAKFSSSILLFEFQNFFHFENFKNTLKKYKNNHLDIIIQSNSLLISDGIHEHFIGISKNQKKLFWVIYFQKKIIFKYPYLEGSLNFILNLYLQNIYRKEETSAIKEEKGNLNKKDF